MSYSALKWSYTAPEVVQAGLSPTELAVLRALCWLYKDEGATRWTQNCFPGVARLATMTGLKAGAVNKAKRRLKERNLISWLRAANMPGMPRRTNSYRIIACMKLERELRQNESRMKPVVLGEDGLPAFIEDDGHHPMLPGVNDSFPSYESVAPLLNAGRPPICAQSLVYALAFVGDTPDHRRVLAKIVNDETIGFIELHNTIVRVMHVSANGRMITNRLGYLLKSINAIKRTKPKKRRMGWRKNHPCDLPKG